MTPWRQMTGTCQAMRHGGRGFLPMFLLLQDWMFAWENMITSYGSPSITMMTLLQIERKDNYWGVLRRCIAKWLCRPMRDPQILPQERQGYVALEGVGTAAR